MCKLQIISLANLCIFTIICILSVPHVYFQVSGGTIGAKTQLTILSTVILILEVVGLVISSRIIHVGRHQNLEGETAAEIADALIGADFFKDPWDSPTIANTHSELEIFETIQMVELAFECCLFVSFTLQRSFAYEIRHRVQQKCSTPSQFICWMQLNLLICYILARWGRLHHAPKNKLVNRPIGTIK